MAEVMVVLAWIGLGLAVEMVVADHERHVAWFAAGSLLGPLWWVVLADRQTLAASSIESSGGPGGAADRERGRGG